MIITAIFKRTCDNIIPDDASDCKYLTANGYHLSFSGFSGIECPCNADAFIPQKSRSDILSMASFLVSGLVNTETTVKVRGFPIEYYPIDYPFFGVNTSVSGVGFNISKALTALGDHVDLCSMVGSGFSSDQIVNALNEIGIRTDNIRRSLPESPSSVVLYDGSGRRQIYCDLKNIQETAYPFSEDIVKKADIVVACNINFNRDLLPIAQRLGKTVATDVHVLRDPEDEYNRDFMAAADILFLSNEGISGSPKEFIQALEDRYHNRMIVLGMGARGALLYLRDSSRFLERPAFDPGQVVNTVGAGDALFAGFLHYYAKGLEPAEALDRAQLFAALKIRHSGAGNGFVTEAELESYLTH